MNIRFATVNDFDAWLPLWKGYQDFYQTQISNDVTHETWRRFMDVEEPMWCSLAQVDSTVVGLVHHIYHRSCWTTGNYCYLQDLYVDNRYRSKGVGRALIEHVKQHARQVGASRVHWLTHETNQDAMKLYDQIAQKSGFVQYRILL